MPWKTIPPDFPRLPTTFWHFNDYLHLHFPVHYQMAPLKVFFTLVSSQSTWTKRDWRQPSTLLQMEYDTNGNNYLWTIYKSNTRETTVALAFLREDQLSWEESVSLAIRPGRHRVFHERTDIDSRQGEQMRHQDLVHQEDVVTKATKIEK